MNEEKKRPDSCLRSGETIAVLGWIPVHLALLPHALIWLFPQMDDGDLNFWLYAIGAAFLVLLCRRFLRRDFETLCDHPGAVLRQGILCYGLMMLGNLLVNLALGGLLPEANPNNQAVMEVYRQSGGKITAATVLLAPLVEELMFRAGIFGFLRRRNRVLAYAVCILLFSVYHVWPFALENPLYWLYLLQYVPATFALCYCYERTETIWASIFLHMLINGISLWLLSMLEAVGL